MKPFCDGIVSESKEIKHKIAVRKKTKAVMNKNWG